MPSFFRMYIPPLSAPPDSCIPNTISFKLSLSRSTRIGDEYEVTTSVGRLYGNPDKRFPPLSQTYNALYASKIISGLLSPVISPTAALAAGTLLIS